MKAILFVIGVFLFLSCNSGIKENKNAKIEIDSFEVFNECLELTNDSNYKVMKDYFYSVDSSKNKFFLNFILNFPFDESINLSVKQAKLDFFIQDTSIFTDTLQANMVTFTKQGKQFSISPYPFIVGWYHRRSLEGQLSKKDSIFHCLIVNFERSEKNLSKYFNRYKPIIYQKIDTDAYKNLGLKKTLTDLIKSYQFLKSMDYGNTFDKIDKTKNMLEHHFFNKEEEKLSRYYYYENWTYSFWYRRYLEGNMEVVYEILREIQDHYERI